MYVKYKNMHEMELLVSKYLECLKVTKLKMKRKLINGLRSDSKLLEVCLCHMEHFYSVWVSLYCSLHKDLHCLS